MDLLVVLIVGRAVSYLPKYADVSSRSSSLESPGKLFPVNENFNSLLNGSYLVNNIVKLLWHESECSIYRNPQITGQALG